MTVVLLIPLCRAHTPKWGTPNHWVQADPPAQDQSLSPMPTFVSYQAPWRRPCRSTPFGLFHLGCGHGALSSRSSRQGDMYNDLPNRLIKAGQSKLQSYLTEIARVHDAVSLVVQVLHHTYVHIVLALAIFFRETCDTVCHASVDAGVCVRQASATQHC